MGKRLYKMVLFFSLWMFLFGCAAQQVQQSPAPPAFKPVDLNPMVRSGQYLQKVNNFLVILDASGTMKGAEFDTATEVIRRMNLTIPDLKLKSGLRSFGFVLGEQTYMLYGMADHDKAKFNAAMPGFAGQGLTPLADSIATAGSDLKGSVGKSALIVVSDGDPSIDPSIPTQGSSPKAAAALKKQYGDRLCIYTVHVGNNPVGKEIMDNIAKAGECGFGVRAAEIMSPEGMANFVEKAFLEKGSPPPAPPPPAPKPAPAPPPPPKPAPAPPPPAPKVIDKLTLQVLFDVDRATITEAGQKELQKAVAFVKKYPGAKIEVDGHTDNTGTDAYNQKLSERRAAAVKDYLIKEASVDSSKITAVGYGLAKPVADNKTAAGRARNRRVEILILSD